MLRASYIKRDLVFKEAGGTSRGVLLTKPSWFIRLENEKGDVGMGECSVIPGLSPDDTAELPEVIHQVCSNINNYCQNYHTTLRAYPALRFALETALKGLTQQSAYALFPSAFIEGKASIPINGLIWMGDHDTMLKRIEAKLRDGFSCLKLKVGAIDFEKELSLLKHIRQHYSRNDLELRVDANGAFAPENALERLEALSAYDIHSIEQPIKAGQWEAMHALCQQSPIPIAFDEELIGISDRADKESLLKDIKPQYIILKPSLIGGFQSADEWIALAQNHQIGWWATSALESNLGLSAIAQWVFQKNNPLRQGLGTGQVFTNNLTSPLFLKGEQLYYQPERMWSNPFSEQV
ncbi:MULTISPECIES: o-succinylbenzoate synthase [unclassified Carboxylicivirga]|uniref:o-succinylbenzoate synthase n=1 Tax=Carboxylicivirga TaxID=1628153 RepID=UPI003D345373